MSTSSPFKILLAIYVLTVSSCGQECDPNGVSCISCGEYQKCSGGLPTGPIFSCKKGVERGGEPFLEYCWTKLNCNGVNECIEVGIFPNAIIESNFFVCLPDGNSGFVKFDFMCPEEEFFEQTSRMCVSRAATSEAAPNSTSEKGSTDPMSITTTPTATTPTPTTPTPTTPTPTTPTPTTPIPTTPTPTTPIPTTPTPTTPTSTTPPSFVCNSSGIFPSPTNCKMYFRCSTSHKKFSYICPGASYFNEYILKCSLIITSSCQKQILQNITTSTTALTTTTTTTTPPPPSNESPSVPFSCSTAGTFENPLNCKTYYRCSSTGKSFLYVCPGDSYYNELTQRCGLTITPKCRSKLNTSKLYLGNRGF